jgi:hypothetical protein
LGLSLFKRQHIPRLAIKFFSRRKSSGWALSRRLALAFSGREGAGRTGALGLVTSDSFGGLRALLVPSGRRKPSTGGRRKRRTVYYGMANAGRWVSGYILWETGKKLGSNRMNGLGCVVTLLKIHEVGHATHLYQVSDNLTHMGDSRIGVGLIQRGKQLSEVCHGRSYPASP